MWFLIKGAFWFSMVLVLLPFLDPSATDTLENGPKVDVGDTFSAATEAFGYISAICAEKPDVCVKGAETFVALGHRAREGARVAYTFLDQQFAEPGDPVTTGTIAATPALATGETARPAPDEAAASPAARPRPVEVMFKTMPVPEPRIEPKHSR